ncbi:hypothetical protein [Metabacillus sp. 84]|uniref:hypothetical protein n=1 Tax=unclassified Metabacillus TaxID=2675274 RepID=UPI003CEFDD3F
MGLFIRISLAMTLFMTSGTARAKEADCPDASLIERTSLRDRDALIASLGRLVPETFGKNSRYVRWEAGRVLPLPLAKGRWEYNHYNMAKHFCGKPIARQSWLVHLSFKAWKDRYGPGQDNQIYAVKLKTTGWTVWFRYY